MLKSIGLAAAALLLASAAEAQAPKINDAQIAHIAYTAGNIDIAAAKQALAKSKNNTVTDFAKEMQRDHEVVNRQALDLVNKLGVTPQVNPTSQALQKDASAKLADYAKLSGKAFDKAYLENEVAYHKTVDAALSDMLIPNAQNAELKSLLQTGLKLFTEHEMHAEHAVAALK